MNNKYSFTSMFNSKRFTFILSALLIILVNILGASIFLRVDLTSSKAYTLSSLSKDLVKKSVDPINVDVFFSRDIPSQYKDVSQYLKSLLREYKSASKGKFDFEFLDVSEDETVNLAQAFGVQKVQIRDNQEDRRESIDAYMSIVIQIGDVREVLPVTSTDGLEFMLTSVMREIIHRKRVLANMNLNAKITLYRSNSLKEAFPDVVNPTEEGLNKVFRALKEEHGGFLETAVVSPTSQEASLLVDEFGINAGDISGGKVVLAVLVEASEERYMVDLMIIFGGQLYPPQVEGIEKQLSDIIKSMTSVKARIGYLTNHNEIDLNVQDERGGSFLKQVIEGDFELVPISLESTPQPADSGIAGIAGIAGIESTEIPSGIKTIVINGAKASLSEAEIFKLDQFLMQGGSVFILRDPFQQFQIDQYSPPVFLPITTGLEEWLSSKGITVENNIVNDIENLSIYMDGQAAGQAQQYFLPVVTRNSINTEHVITANLNTLIMPFVSSITVDQELVKDKEYDIHELIKSSLKSWLLEGEINLENNLPWPNDLLKEYTLSVIAEGNFESYFTEIPESLKENKFWQNRSVISKSINPGKIMVISTAVFTENYLYRDFAYKNGLMDQLLLMINSLDYCNDSSGMAELRNKGRGINPLKKPSDSAKSFILIFNIGGIALMVIIAGFLVWLWNKARREKIKNRYSNTGGQDE